MAFERVSIQEAKGIILNRRRGKNREDSILVGKYDGLLVRTKKIV